MQNLEGRLNDMFGFFKKKKINKKDKDIKIDMIHQMPEQQLNKKTDKYKNCVRCGTGYVKLR
jgi:hypothetical protein